MKKLLVLIALCMGAATAREVTLFNNGTSAINVTTDGVTLPLRKGMATSIDVSTVLEIKPIREGEGLIDGLELNPNTLTLTVHPVAVK